MPITELVRLLAITAQLQIVNAQDLNNQVLFERAVSCSIEQRAVLSTQRHGNQARPNMAAPRQWHQDWCLGGVSTVHKQQAKTRRGAVF